jgi:hypothetical protein
LKTKRIVVKSAVAPMELSATATATSYPKKRLKNMKTIIKSEWDAKFLREQPFMSFGSMCNLIGQAYHGKGISEEELIRLTRTAFKLAQEFVLEAYNSAIPEAVKNQANGLPF